MRITHVLVELDDGSQEFFDSPYYGFKYAREQEQKRRHSVEYVAIGDFYENEGTIYRGQNLRILLRSLEPIDWLKADFGDQPSH